MTHKLEIGRIYSPKPIKKMNIIVFVSGGGGNLRAAINLSLQQPELLKIGLVVSDRFHIPALEIAHMHNIPVIAKDFEKECGMWADCKNNLLKTSEYKKNSIKFHDQILNQIKRIESDGGESFDLVVLSYHRWIRGKLLEYFEGRIINQHAGDLTVFENNNNLLTRKYIGINPVYLALRSGERKTRTSTFVVRDNEDGGEIICQGPWVEYTGSLPITKEMAWQHELIQKEKSDWPALTWALTEIARGAICIEDGVFADGCRILSHHGKLLPYGGVDLNDLFKNI